MAFLRPAVFDPGPILRCDGFYMRTPALGDHAAWAELRETSRAFLSPWEPSWPVDDFERAAFRRRIKRYQLEVRNDQGYPFFLFRSSDHALLGGLTLSYVRRGVTHQEFAREKQQRRILDDQCVGHHDELAQADLLVGDPTEGDDGCAGSL